MNKEQLSKNIKKILDDPVIYDSVGEVHEERFWETFWRESGFTDEFSILLDENDVLRSEASSLKNEVDGLESDIEDYQETIKELKEANDG